MLTKQFVKSCLNSKLHVLYVGLSFYLNSVVRPGTERVATELRRFVTGLRFVSDQHTKTAYKHFNAHNRSQFPLSPKSPGVLTLPGTKRCITSLKHLPNLLSAESLLLQQ